MNSYYPSRISIPLWGGIWGFVMFIASSSLSIDFSEETVIESIIIAVVWITIFLFLGLVCFGIGYKIVDDKLVIKIGPIRERQINIKNIHSLERSYNLFASPANALKRLRINYGERYVLISPASEAELIRHLKKINPEIQVYNLEKTINF